MILFNFNLSVCLMHAIRSEMKRHKRRKQTERENGLRPAAWIFLFSQFGVSSEFCPVTHTQLQHVLYLSSMTCVYLSRCLRRPCSCWLRWGRSLCWTLSSWTLSWWRMQTPCLRPTACGRGSVCWATTCSPAAAEPARNSKPGVCTHVCVCNILTYFITMLPYTFLLILCQDETANVLVGVEPSVQCHGSTTGNLLCGLCNCTSHETSLIRVCLFSR